MILLLLLISVPVAAEAPVPVLSLPDELSLLERDHRGMTIELTLPSYRLVTAQGPEGLCRRVVVDGWGRTAHIGRPELPRLGCSIPLPGGGGLSAEVLEVEFDHHDIERLYPVQPLSPESGGAQLVKGITGTWPAALVEVDPPAVQRGRRLARVLFQPIQWDQSSGGLRCATRLRVRLTYERSSPNPLAVPPEAVEGTISAGGMSGNPGSPLDGALRIEVEQDGFYAMDYTQELLAAGRSPGEVDAIDPSTLKLFNRGRQVPVLVVSPEKDPPWPGGNFFFYGRGIDSACTTTNVYWLYWNGSPGMRMGWVNGTLSGGTALSAATTNTVRVEENHRLWEATPGAPEQDYWFWDLLTAPVSTSCQLQVIDPAPGEWDGTLRVSYRGRSTSTPHPNHHTRVQVNGLEVGDQFWDGDHIFVQEVSIPSTVLTPGVNTVSVSCPGDTGAVVDSIYLNWIELDYRRRLRAADNELHLVTGGSGPQIFAVNGFTEPVVAVLDITSPPDVKQVLGVGISEAGGQYMAVFRHGGAGSAQYLALAPGRFQTPAAVQGWTSPGLWAGGDGADYILVTPREFLPAAEPLVLFRQNQGYRAVAVALEDIYDEFNQGIADPAALKAFLSRAYHGWPAPAPLFVLLLGDANTDYLDYFGTGKQSRVPVHLSLSELGLTPDDNWYVCVEGDDVLPEMCIGRLPARDAVMAKRMISRVLAHEQSTAAAPGRSMFVADDEPVFESLNETLVGMLPAGVVADRVYLSQYTAVDDATDDIVRGINLGEMIVHYNGHGSVTGWAGEYMLLPGDVALLTNADDLSFVLTMTCLNGYFSHPFYYCLAEELASAQTGGGIGCFSPSGLSYTWEQDLLAPEIFSMIFDQGEDRLGVIVTEAKLAAHALGGSDVMVSMFTLLGDPASRLKSWE
jgi:hypothetical protein